jgi:hypothetical protein
VAANSFSHQRMIRGRTRATSTLWSRSGRCSIWPQCPGSGDGEFDTCPRTGDDADGVCGKHRGDSAGGHRHTRSYSGDATAVKCYVGRALSLKSPRVDDAWRRDCPGESAQRPRLLQFPADEFPGGLHPVLPDLFTPDGDVLDGSTKQFLTGFMADFATFIARVHSVVPQLR